MKRVICVLLAMLAVASASIFSIAQETAPKPAIAKAQPAAPDTEERPVPQASRAAPQVGRGVISSIRERREKRRERGLELAQLVAVGEELKAEGEIYEGMPDVEIVAAIAARTEANNPSAFSDHSALDWQAIFDLIERLLPIILRLLGL